MASLTAPTALPDGGGVFSQANLNQLNANIASGAVNLTNINAALAAAATTPVPSSQLDPTTIQYVSTTYTLAQLLATNTVPRTLVAAQGAGTLIEVVSLVLCLTRGSAAFVGGGACAAYLGTDATGVLASATIAATVFTTFAASQSILVAGALAVNANSTILNKALVFANPTADFTSGTGATGVVKLAYRVHTGLT